MQYHAGVQAHVYNFIQQYLGQDSDTAQSNSNTMERESHPTCMAILTALGIGAALVGALLTIAVVLAAVSIVCCCHQMKKRKLLMR